MSKEEGEIVALRNEMYKQLKGLTEAFEKKLGPLGELASPKEMMEAYLSMTTDQKVQKAREVGDVEMNKYVANMERRLRQSQRSKENAT